MCLIKYFFLFSRQEKLTQNERMKVEMSMEQSNTHTHTKMAYTQRGEERERRRKKYGSRVNQTKITVINLRLSMDR